MEGACGGVTTVGLEGSRCGDNFVVVIVIVGVVVACVVVIGLKGRFVAVLSWLLSL